MYSYRWYLDDIEALESRRLQSSIKKLLPTKGLSHHETLSNAINLLRVRSCTAK